MIPTPMPSLWATFINLLPIRAKTAWVARLKRRIQGFEAQRGALTEQLDALEEAEHLEGYRAHLTRQIGDLNTAREQAVRRLATLDPDGTLSV